MNRTYALLLLGCCVGCPPTGSVDSGGGEGGRDTSTTDHFVFLDLEVRDAGIPDQIASDVQQVHRCEATSGQCYYIAPGGTDCADAGCGSLESPWGSLIYAAAHTSPGDFVYLRGGTYHEAFYGVNAFNSGAEGAEIVYSAYTGESVTVDMTDAGLRSNLELDGRSYLRFRDLKFMNNNVDDGVIRMRFGAHHITFEQCEIQGSGVNGAVVFIRFGENHHITFSRCVIHDNNPDPTGYDCVGVFNTDHFTIEDSRIYNCGHSAVLLMDGSNNAVISGNEIYGEPGSRWGSGIIGQGGSGHHVHHNRIHHGVNAQCAKCAIQWTASDSVVEYNVIHAAGRKGISLENGDASNNIIRHNTIFDSGKDPGPGWSHSEQDWVMCDTVGAPPLGIVEINGRAIRNNRFVDNLVHLSGVPDFYGVTAYGYWEVSYNDGHPVLLGNELHHNLFYYSSGAEKVIFFNDGQDRQLTLAEADAQYTAFHDNIQQDPQLTDPANGDLAPALGSPACGNSSDGSDIGALPCNN